MIRGAPFVPYCMYLKASVSPSLACMLEGTFRQNRSWIWSLLYLYIRTGWAVVDRSRLEQTCSEMRWSESEGRDTTFLPHHLLPRVRGFLELPPRVRCAPHPVFIPYLN